MAWEPSEMQSVSCVVLRGGDGMSMELVRGDVWNYKKLAHQIDDGRDGCTDVKHPVTVSTERQPGARGLDPISRMT